MIRRICGTSLRVHSYRLGPPGAQPHHVRHGRELGAVGVSDDSHAVAQHADRREEALRALFEKPSPHRSMVLESPGRPFAGEEDG